MEEQEEELPSVATQTEPTAVCHQGTSVNEFLIATNGAITSTERIRVKCYTVLYGRASRYIPAPSDHEHRPGLYTQTPRKTGEEKMTQVPDVHPNNNNYQSNRAKARKCTNSKANTQTPSNMNNYYPDGVKLSKNAKRKIRRSFRKLARMYNAHNRK